MKGKMKETVRKWWVLAIVATLALSLTSCGMKRTSLMSGGGVGCDGDLGYFTIATYPLGGNKYEVRITALEVYDPSDVVDIGLWVEDPDDWYEIFSGAQLLPGKVFRKEIYDSDLDTFDTVLITGVSGDRNQIYPFRPNDKFNSCYLPVPGESDQGY